MPINPASSQQIRYDVGPNPNSFSSLVSALLGGYNKRQDEAKQRKHELDTIMLPTLAKEGQIEAYIDANGNIAWRVVKNRKKKVEYNEVLARIKVDESIKDEADKKFGTDEMLSYPSKDKKIEAERLRKIKEKATWVEETRKQRLQDYGLEEPQQTNTVTDLNSLKDVLGKGGGGTVPPPTTTGGTTTTTTTGKTSALPGAGATTFAALTGLKGLDLGIKGANALFKGVPMAQVGKEGTKRMLLTPLAPILGQKLGLGTVLPALGRVAGPAGWVGSGVATGLDLYSDYLRNRTEAENQRIMNEDQQMIDALRRSAPYMANPTMGSGGLFGR